MNMNATHSDTPPSSGATRKTLHFSDNALLLPSKNATPENVEVTFVNAVESLPDNIRTIKQVKKDASADYTKLLSKNSSWIN